MKFSQAIFKFIARKANDKVTYIDICRTQHKAYQATGKQIEKAKKEGRFINGSNVYKINFKKAKSKAIKNGRAREQFINDL
jgi:hypothetical protein